jgi:GNAT superfamily N-acetyltransferase
MITTILLPQDDYKLYGDWLLRQDAETLKLYFGIAVTPGFVHQLVNRIVEAPGKHYFLVALDQGQWVGVVHMATYLNLDIEFGVIVDAKRRGQGIADRLLDEAVTWAQNRRYKRLYLHCLTWNQAIKHLCQKYGLKIHSSNGSSEVDVALPPPSLISVGKEFASMNRNIFTKMLEVDWDVAK